MNAPMKPLLELCAADLMSQNLVAIPVEMSLQAAARILSRAQVTGAPVVCNDGRCVGVISNSDFMRLAENENMPRPGERRTAGMCSAWQMMDAENLPELVVGDVMTRDPVVVQPTTSICDLAWKMLEGHIHRVIVVDRLEKPVGIVSTTDILAALARESYRSKEPHDCLLEEKRVYSMFKTEEVPS